MSPKKHYSQISFKTNISVTQRVNFNSTENLTWFPIHSFPGSNDAETFSLRYFIVPMIVLTNKLEIIIVRLRKFIKTSIEQKGELNVQICYTKISLVAWLLSNTVEMLLWNLWLRNLLAKRNHLHLYHLTLGKVPFWLVAVFVYVTSYTTSLFGNIMPSRPHFAREKDNHNTGNFTPYSLGIVCGFFNVPHWNFKHGRYCETGPTVYSPYQRILESLTLCWCNYKGSTFSSVILRPWVLVRPESNSWQPDQPTEPPIG